MNEDNIIICPDCRGKGYFHGNNCKKCDSQGWIDKNKLLKVKNV